MPHIDPPDPDHPLLLEIFLLQEGRTSATLPRHRHRLSRDAVSLRQRARLLLATADVVNELTLAKTTARHIAERAGVSTKTFYSQFANKDEAFLATFTLLDGIVAQTIQRAIADVENPRVALRRAVDALLSQLAAWPTITRTRLIAGRAGGPEADRSRYDILDVLVAAISQALEHAAAIDPAVATPPQATLQILAGGVYEHVTRHVFEHDPSTLPQLAPGIVDAIERTIFG